jgi:predicted transcriptional regulator
MQYPLDLSQGTQFQTQKHRISFAMSSFTLPLLRGIYEAFGGDILLCIVLGEIAARNAQRWLAQEDNDPQVLEDLSRHPEVLRPCNALSIAEATGIPRETVRRKVLTLIERGMVYRAPNGHLFVHPSVPQRFEELTQTMVPALLEAASSIQSRLQPEP